MATFRKMPYQSALEGGDANQGGPRKDNDV
jgi:hypothetical protein